MKEIMIATSNEHKVKEYRNMLEPLGYSVKSLNDLDYLIDVDETGTTFEENAILKAEEVCKIIKIPVISDDSGLEIDALNKEPGINSARYLGHDTDYTFKNNTILKRLENVEDDKRTCRFVCVIAYAQSNKKTRTFRGVIEGIVAKEISGVNGFGYDPIFFVPEYDMTLAELSENEKNKISHRSIALKLFLESLENEEE